MLALGGGGGTLPLEDVLGGGITEISSLLNSSTEKSRVTMFRSSVMVTSSSACSLVGMAAGPLCPTWTFMVLVPMSAIMLVNLSHWVLVLVTDRS